MLKYLFSIIEEKDRLEINDYLITSETMFMDSLTELNGKGTYFLNLNELSKKSDSKDSFVEKTQTFFDNSNIEPIISFDLLEIVRTIAAIQQAIANMEERPELKIFGSITNEDLQHLESVHEKLNSQYNIANSNSVFLDLNDITFNKQKEKMI